MMTKPAFSTSMSNRAGGTGLFVGPALHVSEQYVHQRLPGGLVVKHELVRFRPDPAIGALRDAIKPGLAGPVIAVSYEGEVARLERVRIDETVKLHVHQDVQKWADQHLTDANSRQAFERSLRKAIDELGTSTAGDRSVREFERSLVHEDARSAIAGRPEERISERHARFAATQPDETTKASPRLSVASAQRWAALDLADMARLNLEPEHERERQRALAVVRRGPPEYQEALARAQVEPRPAAGNIKPPRTLSEAPSIERDRGLER